MDLSLENLCLNISSHCLKADAVPVKKAWNAK
jgi:hypothetical protein